MPLSHVQTDVHLPDSDRVSPQCVALALDLIENEKHRDTEEEINKETLTSTMHNLTTTFAAEMEKIQTQSAAAQTRMATQSAAAYQVFHKRQEEIKWEVRKFNSKPLGTLLSNFLDDTSSANTFNGLAPAEVLHLLLVMPESSRREVSRAIRIAKRNRCKEFKSYTDLVRWIRWWVVFIHACNFHSYLFVTCVFF